MVKSERVKKFLRKIKKTLDNKITKCYFKYKDVSTQLKRVLISKKSHERM